MKMKCTEEQLIDNLVQTYLYHFKRSYSGKKIKSRSPNINYGIGKDDGATEAIGTILQQVVGSAVFDGIFQQALEYAKETEKNAKGSKQK